MYVDTHTLVVDYCEKAQEEWNGTTRSQKLFKDAVNSYTERRFVIAYFFDIMKGELARILIIR